MRIGAIARALRIHALICDASGFVVAIEARHAEREVAMLDLFLAVPRRHGAPDGLYLDNVAMHRGEELRLACERIGADVLHARPWRRLRPRRDGALLALVARRLPRPPQEPRSTTSMCASTHYHYAPRGGLVGKPSSETWARARCRALIGPLLVRRVGGYDRRVLLVAAADDVGEHFMSWS